MTTTPTQATFRFPVYSTVLDEHVDLVIPAKGDWAKRLQALVDCESALYGPQYRRGVVEAVLDMSRFVKWNDLDAAENYLTRAEYLAGVRK